MATIYCVWFDDMDAIYCVRFDDMAAIYCVQEDSYGYNIMCSV